MKRRFLAILMAAVMTGTLPGSALMTNAAGDELIVEIAEEPAGEALTVDAPSVGISDMGMPAALPAEPSANFEEILDEDSQGPSGATGTADGLAGDLSGAAGNTDGSAGDLSGAAGNADGSAGDLSGTAGNTDDSADNLSGAAGSADGLAGDLSGAAGSADGSAGEPGETTANAGGLPGAAGIAGLGAPIIMIEDIQTETTAETETETEPDSEQETVIAYETETGMLQESGLASEASSPQYALMRIASTAYSGSYGAQLSGNSKTVYDKMKEVLLGEAAPADTTIALTTPITFTLQKYVAETWNTDKLTDAGYQAGMNEVKYIVQSAFDAFAYDCPQVFWLKAPKYNVSISITKGASITGTVKSVTIGIGSAVLYEGAFADRAAFNTAVQSAVIEIKKELSSDTSRAETLKTIHDYLCEKIVYGENTFSHSAVGVFLKGGTVVCEGYAKSYKILCDQFGIPCALVVGDANEGAHMWNYVQMEDTNWYLVDVTWDDQTTGIFDTYFLAGNNTTVFNNKKVSEERTVRTNFSNSTSTMSFTIPVLNSESYAAVHGLPAHTHSWKVIESNASCRGEGTTKVECRGCGQTKTFTAPALPHELVEISDNNATCMKDGTKRKRCSVCGYEEAPVEDPGTKLPHRFENYVSDNNATCQADGTKTAFCEYDCGTSDTVPDVGSRLPNHVFENYVSNHDATCTADGTKTALCKFNCGASDTVPDVGTKLPHVFENYVSNHDAVSCMADGTKTAFCIYNCGTKDTVTDPGSRLAHSFVNYVSNNDATRDQDGTKTASCIYGCGTKDTVTDPGTKLTSKPKLNVSSLKLKMGQSTTCVEVSGLVRGDKIVSWKSSNTKIVKVTKKGKITAQKKTGSAKITVTVKNGKHKYPLTVKVTVQKNTVRTTKISGVEEKLTLKKGKTVRLKPVLKPLTSQEKITYSSSNKKVATVSASGKIKAIKKGTTTITVKSGSVTVKCKVTVK